MPRVVLFTGWHPKSRQPKIPRQPYFLKKKKTKKKTKWRYTNWTEPNWIYPNRTEPATTCTYPSVRFYTKVCWEYKKLYSQLLIGSVLKKVRWDKKNYEFSNVRIFFFFFVGVLGCRGYGMSGFRGEPVFTMYYIT